MGRYLEGELISIKRETLKSLTGKKITYLQKKDIDKSGRGYFFPRVGRIDGVYRSSVIINGDYIQIGSLVEATLIG